MMFRVKTKERVLRSIVKIWKGNFEVVGDGGGMGEGTAVKVHETLLSSLVFREDEGGV